MRNLNEMEMELVAGGFAGTHVSLKAIHATVALSSSHGKLSMKKVSSHAAAGLVHDGGGYSTNELEDDGGGDSGGGGSGGDDGGGGGEDDGGGGGGDSGGGDDGGISGNGDSGPQNPPPSGDDLNNRVAGNGDITGKCQGTAGGGAECVRGTADSFIVTDFDKNGNVISQTSCTKDSNWSFSLALDFIKKIFGGGEITIGENAGYTCKRI